MFYVTFLRWGQCFGLMQMKRESYSSSGPTLSVVSPGDVPGVSQRLPQLVLLCGRLLTQQTDTLRRQQRRHDGLQQIFRAVRYQLVRKRIIKKALVLY